MQSSSRSIRLLARQLRQVATPTLSYHPYRFASSDYGSTQGGQAQSDAPNPKSHLEHPGPESPASKGTAKSTSSPSSSSSEKSTGNDGSANSKQPSTSHGGSPAIHHPKSAAEKEDPDVKKHNDDMRNRSEQSVNQLGEDDNKVDPKFWKGDVGKENKD